MARIIALANQKGGVGKTTTAVNLAACLAALQYRTLLIDLDPQGNATSGVGCLREELNASIYEVLCGEIALSNVIEDTEVDLLWLVPARTDLAAAEIELMELDAPTQVLKAQLETISEGYDFVLIDCPPSLGMLTVNALVASDSVLVPIQAEYYALEGMARLLDTIKLVREQQNPDLQLEGMLMTMYDSRVNLSRQVEAEVREHFPDDTYETVIPRNVRLSEAPSYGEPIIMYDIDSRGAKSYLALAREFIERHMQRAS